MNKLVLKVVAILALLVQVLLPVWWAAVVASFYYFWVEGIFGGGVLGSEIVIGLSKVGESVVGRCFLGQPCSFSILLWGIFSVYSIFAAIAAIRVSFSIKMNVLELRNIKKDLIFLLINILTIVLAVSFIFLNGGIIPRL